MTRATEVANLRPVSAEVRAEQQAQAKLLELYTAAQKDLDLRADLLQFWARREVPRVPQQRPASTAAGQHRGVITANRRTSTPCLCGKPIVPGELILKRWNQWIHDGCYEALQAAKSGAR